ncbi:MAG: transposase, partial [Cytophagaceae bacterium]
MLGGGERASISFVEACQGMRRMLKGGMRRHELTDEEWQSLAPLVRNPMGRPTKFGNRHLFNAVLWKVRT